MGKLFSALVTMLLAIIHGTTNIAEAYEIATAELKTSAQGLRDELAIERAKSLEALTKS